MKTTFRVEMRGIVSRLTNDYKADRRATAEEIEELLDQVWDELLALEARDLSISAKGEDASWVVSLDVEALQLELAQSQAVALVRCALHAVGIHTPGWEKWELIILGSNVETTPTQAKKLAAV